MAKVLELLLNEGAGNIAHDTSGHGNDGTIDGAIWQQLISGKPVLSFNGVDNNLIVPNSPSLDIATVVGLRVWMYPQLLQSGLWVGKASGGAIGGYSFYYHQPNGRIAGYVEYPGGWGALVYAPAVLQLNTWYDVFYTFDGQYGRIYINGELVGQSLEYTSGMYPVGSPLDVKATFGGLVGAIEVYDHVPSDAEIEDLHNADKPHYEMLAPTELITYITLPISDIKILPHTVLPNENIGDVISLRGCPGEYRPATFTVYSPIEAALTIEASPLTGPGTIPGPDIRAVKCWYQAGYTIYDVTNKHLTPELLLKDDFLVKVENGENYLKLTTGEYRWISDPTKVPRAEITIIPIDELPVQDSLSLQPVTIPAGTNKQFWITLKIPSDAIAGIYTGKIQLSSNGIVVQEIDLQLQVLPIELQPSYLTYSICYRGRLKPIGSISSEDKNEVQMRAELENMITHGVPTPSSYDGFNMPVLSSVLSMRNDVGMSGQPLFLLNVGMVSPDILADAMQFAQGYGVSEVYFFTVDEPTQVGEIREFCLNAHTVGAKTFAYINRLEVGQQLADVLDVCVCTPQTAETLLPLYHSFGNKVYSYANPQVGEERPETYRRNYGLYLWQKDYDGALDYAYQHAFGSIWNDFDHTVWRDHNFTYPTIDGVIDTIQWEGWREGVNDIRYLTTLLGAIDTAKAQGVDTSAAESYLANLKVSNLMVTDLDQVRREITNHILYIQGEPKPPPVTSVIETVIVAAMVVAVMSAIMRRV